MAKPKDLTKTQDEILTYTAKSIQEYGYQPSYRDMCQAFGYASLNSVTQHLAKAEKKGYCQRVANRAVMFNWKEYL